MDNDSFQLPEYWCIQSTDETREIINDFILEKGYGDRLYINYMIHYPFVNGGTGSAYFTIQGGYKEITFDQFEKYVLNKNIIIEIDNPDCLIKLLKKLNIQ